MTAPSPFTSGVAVITGAGGGLGAALARQAVSLGMKVALADIDAGSISALAAELGPDAIAIPTDVRDAAAVTALAAAVHARWGGVRLLINNAGIETIGNSWDISPARWQATLDINVMGAIHGVHAFLPHMLAAGQPAWVANTASVGAFGQMPLQTAYIVSKHALQSFTENLALEIGLTAKPIHVASIIPGAVDTGIFDAANHGDAATMRHRAIMQAMLKASMTPATAAAIIFDGLAARQFFITTHPEDARAIIDGRIAFLDAMAAPVLPDQLRALLQGD
ncbi:MAG: SDR family NAD(P)-dependent oxidoreductase [Sandarakinorhabdus sp.]|nr:SDR family NAD(P)-dependent oxidoreductase [Sandarakinorhabdus sp.]